MSICSFAVDWAPNRFFDNDDNGTVPGELLASSGGSLAEKLELAYLERASRYGQEVKEGHERLRWGRGPWPDTYPSVKVNLPGGTEEVIFDHELDARLMEIYVLHGWSGILQLEEALEAAQEKRETRSTQPWFVVVPFYLFTRNRLILLIRQALIEVEKMAAHDAFTRLGETAIAVNTAWQAKFAFEIRHVKARQFKHSSGSWDTPDPYETVYVMGNQELSAQLFPLVTTTVDQRAVLDEQVKRRDYLKGLVEGGTGGAGPTPTGVLMDLEDAKKTVEETNTALYGLYVQISQVEPLVLLAVPLLKKGFDQPTMENVIGETLWPLYGKLDKLAEAINPQTSRVEADFPGLREDTPSHELRLESLFSFVYDIERLCAKRAISEAEDNPPYLVLLSAETLVRLVATNAIETGTLAYFVCRRYTLTLMEEIEKKLNSEAQLERAIAQLTSAISLLSLVIPPLRIASLLSGLPAFVYQAYSVVNQLSVMDQAINQRLLESGAGDIGSLAAIGEIVAQRSEYAQQITEAMITEFALIVAAGKWGAFKRGLELRDYYADLETLLQD